MTKINASVAKYYMPVSFVLHDIFLCFARFFFHCSALQIFSGWYCYYNFYCYHEFPILPFLTWMAMSAVSALFGPFFFVSIFASLKAWIQFLREYNPLCALLSPNRFPGQFCFTEKGFVESSAYPMLAGMYLYCSFLITLHANLQRILATFL